MSHPTQDDLCQRAYPYDSPESVLSYRPDRACLDLSLPPVDTVFDLHGDPTVADLVILFNGNQFMVVEELLSVFRQHYPSVKHVFYETLPPGMLAQQARGMPLRIGNLTLSLQADVITTGADDMRSLIQEQQVQRSIVYAENTLAILVASGNPLDIRGLADLARPEVRVAMPNPAFEGVGRLIVRAYEQVGGSALVKTIMEQKVADGTTYLTRIHHRQTALRILEGRADAGPLWISEALFQQRLQNAVELIPIADTYNQRGTYHAALLTQAPHAQAASALLDFMQAPTAQRIYMQYGFRLPGGRA